MDDCQAAQQHAALRKLAILVNAYQLRIADIESWIRGGFVSGHDQSQCQGMLAIYEHHLAQNTKLKTLYAQRLVSAFAGVKAAHLQWVRRNHAVLTSRSENQEYTNIREAERSHYDRKDQQG